MALKSPFDKLVNRYGTSCLKYDFGLARKGRTDLLPMWVADMDFALPKDILADFHARIDHGIFGYTDPDADYYEALDGWFSRHHGYHIKPEWVTVGCGIVYGLATAVKAFTRVNDAILIQQPVYYPFREVIEDNGRVFVNSQLHNEGGRYTIDFDDVEKKMIAHNVKALLLCSPHNPVGRVWSRKELERLGDLCLTHHVIILCDEIHCDFVYAPHHFTSFLTLDEKYRRNLAVFTSPSKTFNVAGFQPGNIIIPDETLRQAYRRANAAAGYSQGSIMGQIAVKSCYTKGDAWVKELVAYIKGNIDWTREFVKNHLPKAIMTEPEGTYLVWIDFSGYGLSDDALEKTVTDKAKLWLDSGKIFGPETAQFERFNMAAPRAVIEEAFGRLKEALEG
ncbi:MAG: MalY/PatB family protein [Acidaminococcus sp.]|uniref:cysteine-S-conjugate beta-lyase n=1 Tax=Acidaminococcus intestini TaxID=187327 RepID=A0A943EFH4_9FIRM|nr:MalY/PatB family protein [Acidaminococcus sp.]MBS5519204.1 pyridoxal phosphate-dependent aminotransferase [Acidaminococcus intestini]MDY2738365.1 MalY/PatB family protein [Acidaminococcus sp.]